MLVMGCSAAGCGPHALCKAVTSHASASTAGSGTAAAVVAATSAPPSLFADDGGASPRSNNERCQESPLPWLRTSWLIVRAASRGGRAGCKQQARPLPAINDATVPPLQRLGSEPAGIEGQAVLQAENEVLRREASSLKLQLQHSMYPLRPCLSLSAVAWAAVASKT